MAECNLDITIYGSIQFAEEQIGIVEELKKLGFEAYMASFAAPMTGKTNEEKEKMKLHQKNNIDAIRNY
ncbi:hypothetical protein CO155_01925 [Candidatus Pacearchaeota archaeon CG_4_9_14_3_um_filter_35_19]|nr:hypothetical protein [Candidatus Pacearchaeota archaeon]PJA70039.1 MAG: hypothetical protein CO155_01925 [Candidatus Pacearchaeota archaeon CG_4_9_14_3_um_filter_35_19]